jgi:hypothetical protein
MRRVTVLALSSIAMLGVLVFVASTALAAPTPGPGVAGVTVTATGSALIPPDEDPTSVYTVQLMGTIDAKMSYDAYVAKLDGIRRAVIAAGVPETSVTKAQGWASPNGAGGQVGFNSVFRYEVRNGPVAVAASQAAYAAGASMAYNNMPAPAVGLRRPDPPALDRAIADATALARDYAGRAVRGRNVGEAMSTALSVKGEPEGAPTQWRVEITITFAVAP